jgi:hypothetical protein
MEPVLKTIQPFANNDDSSTELFQVIDAYKYYLMYGARVPMTQWTKRQLELYRALTDDNEQNDTTTG